MGIWGVVPSHVLLVWATRRKQNALTELLCDGNSAGVPHSNYLQTKPVLVLLNAPEVQKIATHENPTTCVLNNPILLVLKAIEETL
jgi:hypothetical protein